MTSATRHYDLAAPGEAKPVLDWLFALAVLAVIGVYIRAIYFTPLEATQGAAQKIYYIHVPSAIGAYCAVSITALASIIYLWLKDERADRLAEASAEVGLVFMTMVLITGPLWAHKIWNAWWVWWDLRLTLSLFLWFVIVGYLVLRGAIEDPGMRGRYSAVLAVLGALLIPFIHLSVYFSTAHMHPDPIVLQPSKPKLPSQMLATFLMGVTAFTLLCLAMIRSRYRLGVVRDRLAALEAERGM
jgi:heme exporter protein C